MTLLASTGFFQDIVDKIQGSIQLFYDNVAKIMFFLYDTIGNLTGPYKDTVVKVKHFHDIAGKFKLLHHNVDKVNCFH
jgi:hypothetical protein